jgi:hypothetical protein
MRLSASAALFLISLGIGIRGGGLSAAIRIVLGWALFKKIY